eukprot:Platyproteum_vivax@DN9273_c0_g1_i1.p1
MCAHLSLMARESLSAVVLLHLFPRSQIDLCVHILETDGAILATLINACSLALVDAGVPVRGLLVAATSAYINNCCLLDINAIEHSAGGPELTVAVDATSLDANCPDPDAASAVLLHCTSKTSRHEFQQLYKGAVSACHEIFKAMRIIIRERLRHTRCLPV